MAKWNLRIPVIDHQAQRDRDMESLQGAVRSAVEVASMRREKREQADLQAAQAQQERAEAERKRGDAIAKEERMTAAADERGRRAALSQAFSAHSREAAEREKRRNDAKTGAEESDAKEERLNRLGGHAYPGVRKEDRPPLTAAGFAQVLAARAGRESAAEVRREQRQKADEERAAVKQQKSVDAALQRIAQKRKSESDRVKALEQADRAAALKLVGFEYGSTATPEERAALFNETLRAVRERREAEEAASREFGGR